MKKVILTSGPRGAGKSEYAKRAQEIHPEVNLLSRDELLIKIFGKTSLSLYDGSHQYAYQLLKDSLKEMLSVDNSCLIFDCWNGSSSERRLMVNMLREYGADKVICWKFITPLEVCMNWFFQKTDVQGYTEISCRNDYKLYHRTSSNIESDGFDGIQIINPVQLTIPGFPLI